MDTALTIEPLRLEDLDAEDAQWLLACGKSGIIHYDAKAFLQMAAQNFAQFWRMKGEGTRGVVMTTISFHGNDKVFDVWLLAGKGIIKHGAALRDRMLEEARGHGCTKFSLGSSSPAIQRIHAKLYPEAKRYVELIMEL